MLHVSILLCLTAGPRVWEEDFPHLNWALVLSIQLVVATNYSIVVPSLYQFITTPTSPPEAEVDHNATDVCMYIAINIVMLSEMYCAFERIHMMM